MSASVFLSAANADYSAARAVYQFLTERGVACFFCDESLLRVGEGKYRATVDRALAAAERVVVVAGSAARAQSEWVQYAWQGFVRGTVTGGRRGNVATVLCGGLEQADLPATLRRGPCLSFPSQLDVLPRLLEGGNAVPDKPAAPARMERRTRRFLATVTAGNVLILGVMVWLLHRTGILPFSGDAPPASSGPVQGSAGDLPAGWGPGREKGESSPESEWPGSAAAGESAGGDNAEDADDSPPPDSGAGTAVGVGDKAMTGTVINFHFGGSGRTSFCFIPRGQFVMGSPPKEPGRGENEAQRSVTISHDFWMARYECTQAVWLRVMGRNPSANNGGQLPVETVSWDEIASGTDCFLARVNRRNLVPKGWRFALPTEAQWEYACRAGTTTPFSFGSILDGTQANCDGFLPYGTTVAGISAGHTTPVGSYSPNAWGLGDMHGNVWEWCADSSAADLSGGTDPPATSGISVRRGGSWRFNGGLCRSASRQWVSRGVGDDTLGFRIAIVPVE